MTATPIVRIPGTAGSATGLSANNNAYSGGVRITVSGLTPANQVLADFRITGGSWSGTPTGGSIQLFAVDRDASGNSGGTPGSTVFPRYVGTFTPTQTTSTFGILALNGVPLSPDADYYVFNNGTTMNLTSFALWYGPWALGTV